MQEKQNVSSNTVSTTDPEEPFFIELNRRLKIGELYTQLLNQ
jgi:hypothetical protein